MERTKKNRMILAVLGFGALLFFVLHIFIGTSDQLTFTDVLREIAHGPGSSDRLNDIVWQIRMPRTLEALLVGCMLAAVGSVFQALLRNPLADPYTVGVSSGAALGGVLVIALGAGELLGRVTIAGAGCVTGLLTLMLVYQLSIRRGVVDVRTLILAGVIIGSMFSAFLSLALLLSGNNEADVLRWLLGDLSTSTWPNCPLLLLGLACGFPILYLESKKLNAFAIGEDTARRLGVDVKRLTKVILVTGGVMTAIAVGTVGIVGFLGLVAPHIARRLVGVDWRWSLPAATLVGGLLLLSSDVIAQRVFSFLTHTPGMDLPVGIVTSLLGAPSLLILLRKAR